MSEMAEELDNPEVNAPAATDAPSDSAPDTPESLDTPEDKSAKVTFSEEQQGIFDREINKKVGETHEERRKRLAAEERVKELEAKLNPTPQRPDIPEKPTDPFDPDYEQNLEAHLKGVAAAEQYDKDQRAASEAALQEQQEQQKQVMENLNKIGATYAERAENLNISKENFQTANQSMQLAGIPGPTMLHIMQEEMGPQIATHLMANPQQQAELAKMNPFQAALYIENTIKPAAKGAVPKVEPPPAPTEDLSGPGAPTESWAPAGAKFY